MRNPEIEIETERLRAFENHGPITQRNISIVPDLTPQFLPPKKSTVKLWIKGEGKWWNPENKVEHP